MAQFRLVARLGEGGMGEVFRATDTRLGRDVAIKFLRDEAEGPRSAERVAREARAAAAVDHPAICPIYEIGEEEGRPFIVMQYVEGETLAQALARGPLECDRALDVAISVAEALAAAHARGILHRDVKPQNVMIARSGQVKVMDFGLARSIGTPPPGETGEATASFLTQPGSIVGTAAYMSPEQARGEALDGRSDVFSLGVVLYEMVTGRPPFTAGSLAETLAAVLSRDPPPLSRTAGASPELERVVRNALRKDRAERTPGMAELLEELRAQRDPARAKAATPTIPRRLTTRALVAIGAAACVAVGLPVVFLVRPRLRAPAAAASVERLAVLAKEGKYAEAFAVAERLRSARPSDPELARLVPLVSDDLSVSTDPPGASVSIRGPGGDAGTRPGPLGTTPLNHVAIPRGNYVLRLELAGYEPFERTISSEPGRTEFARQLSPAIQVHEPLRRSGTLPARMVAITGGRYKLVGWGQPTATEARLDDYFLEKFEVSNRDYLEFVEAGGYRRRELWRRPFVRDGQTLSWEDGSGLLVDRTSMPAPRGWSGGRPLPGTEDLPVTGVTWYEAAAYAEFRGKVLPTVFQWEKAARDGLYVVGQEQVMPWGIGRGPVRGWPANFESAGTVPVESFEAGMSPYGALNMAGNVSEWVSNEAPAGYVTAGGSWRDPPYIFGDFGTLPGLHASDSLGFRCALVAPGAAGDQGGAPISARERAPTYPRSSEATRKSALDFYRYEKTPLEARVEESVETPDWSRVRVSYRGANGERTYAYLYLPKGARPPYQVIQFAPGSAAYSGDPLYSFVEGGRLAPHVRAGRAVFIPALRGFVGRENPPGYRRPDFTTAAFREKAVRDASDERRGVDYLETRGDVDMGRIALMNISISWQGILFAAVEPRFRAVALLGTGLYPEQAGWVEGANPVHLAPHIRAPKLMVNGRWDEDFAFRTEAEPLFKLLSEPKKLELYDGGHVPPPEVAVPVVNRWLDATFGPVRRD